MQLKLPCCGCQCCLPWLSTLGLFVCLLTSTSAAAVDLQRLLLLGAPTRRGGSPMPTSLTVCKQKLTACSAGS